LSYQTALIRLLDRPGGRFLLGAIATRRIRQRLGEREIGVAYIDGLWTRRIGSYFIPDGLRFDYLYANFDAWRGQIEQYVADAKDYWLRHYDPKEGDTIVDVGAGRGEDTLTFSRAVGKTGRVIAIEAHPVSYSVLENFCRLNGLANVTPIHLALMDKPGTVRIIESESSWSTNAVDFGNGTSGVLVQAGTLDELCEAQKVDNIAFLKMNIEGAERYALLGAQAVMPRIRQISVACHDFRADMGHGEQFRTLAFVGRLLREHGFTLTSRPDDPRDYVRDHIFGLPTGSSAVPVNDSISGNVSGAQARSYLAGTKESA
jgi:FkbM family methyltransferase